MARVNSSSSLPALPAPPAEARPVDGSERLLLLDALRGFALCGVFVANLYVWFSGRNFLPYAQLEAAEASASVADLVTARAIPFLVYGKFMTLFSFLFGLGFAVQMGRAEQRGASIVPLYSRRLGVLLAIGLSHLFLLWYGDILSSYALLGFGLMLFRKRSDKTVLLWAAVLILVAPLVGSFLFRVPRLFGSAEATAAASAAAKAALEHSEAVKTATLAAITRGGYLDVLRAQAAFYFSAYTTPLITVVSSLLGVLGRFLLGMVAGRRGLFHEPSQHLPLFRKVLVWGLVAGIIGNGAGFVFQQLFIHKVLNPRGVPWFPFVMTLMGHVGEVGLAAFYGASITLLFQRPVWQRLLSVLAPVGRMALTSYLSQTVISLMLFYGYGLGLVGKFGPAVLLALSLGIFVVQLGVSHLWLARFRFGPVEWVWRSLTYGKAQPMRRAASMADMSANLSAGSS